jgi:putative hydrolase of the HAD superfamily
MLIIDKDFRSVALGLREKFLLGLLSNDVAEWSIHLRNRFDINLFESTVVSGEALCRKPHREIFELFLKRSKADARECVFIDDRKKNLETAASLGFKTVWFRRIEDDHSFTADLEIMSFAGLENAIAGIM